MVLSWKQTAEMAIAGALQEVNRSTPPAGVKEPLSVSCFRCENTIKCKQFSLAVAHGWRGVTIVPGVVGSTYLGYCPDHVRSMNHDLGKVKT